MTSRLEGGRAGLAILTAIGLVLAMLAVFGSAPAQANGNPPETECASELWNGKYFKVQVNDGVLTNDTEGSGQIGFDGNEGTVNWVNNDTDSVFRYLLKVGQGTGNTDTVVNGLWGPGEGGSIDLNEVGLSHITFCFTDPPSTTTPTTTPSTTTPTTTPSTTTPTTTPSTTTPTTTPSTTTPTTTPSTTTPEAPTTTIEVLGTSITAAPSTTVVVEVTEATLPFTGFENGTTGLFAMLLVGIGIVALAGARRFGEEDA